jgi:hypothetical protein
VWHICGTTVVREMIRPTMPPGYPCCDLGFLVGAGEGNRTLMTSLEGWGSAIELRPRWSRRLSSGEVATRVAYRLCTAAWSAAGSHQGARARRGSQPDRSSVRAVKCAWPAAGRLRLAYRDVAQLG